ncbi:MAG: energy-coupling factor transporter transmembrane protein EcfT [Duodenibacillus sp.]|nr:energy-coupling factor transporter transmembrane protein EcfT [Duodenibacillus sp.]
MPALSVLKSTEGPKSWIETLDMRTLMSVCLLASVSTIALSSPLGIALLWAVSFLYFLSLGRLKTVVIAYVTMAAMTIMSVVCVGVILVLFPALAAKLTIESLVVPCVRVCILINVILPLALTCRINRMLAALESLRLPFFLFLPMAVIIRFIPTFADDVEQVWEALKIRGVKASVKNFLRHPILMTRLLIAPILFRSLKTSEQLGVAAELKGISAKTKGKSKKGRPLQSRDWGVLIATVASIVLAFVCQLCMG